jgi:DNA-binding response OmpR family regulator
MQKILIVDDIPANIKILLNTLSDYEILVAINGAGALEIVASEIPDLILLDIMMPGMNGYDVCQHLKANEQTREIPIIFISALNDELDKVKAFSIGGVDYITKPFQYKEVLARVETHLALHNLQRQLRGQNLQLQQEIAERKRMEEKLHLQNEELQTQNEQLDAFAQQLKKLQQEKLYQLNQAYERFVPREFLNLLDKKNVVNIRLGDQVQKEMTVLFSDIRGFTSISENLTPQDNFNFINAYLSRMEPAISEHHGFIDKYIGDAIMALFPNADNAVQAALSMLRRLAEYNLTRGRPGRPILDIGIGVNTGLLMLGTVGCKTRMDSTVISDAVNLASRVEDLTKVYGIPLLITEHTYEKLAKPSQYLMRVIDVTRVKGKSSEITVYEVFDAEPPATIAFKNETIENFESGFVLYHSGEVADAKPLFEKVLQVNSHDTAAQIYLERCQKILDVTMPAKPKILVVDDSQFNVELLSKFLHVNNFEVLAANSGKAALKIVELEPPHLILLDILMPDMDGFETCRQIKANAKSKDIPIIFLTSLSEAKNKLKGFKLGAADYITKPFQQQEILARVKAHLSLYYSQRQLQQKAAELEINNLQLKKRIKNLFVAKIRA